MRHATLTAAALLLARSMPVLGAGVHRVGIERMHLENLTFRLAKAGGVSNGTFEQLVDHSQPERGTFTQHYVYNADYYGGPGSPVILWTPGEGELAGYEGFATNASILGLLAQRVGAGIILVEHRYYGQSSPYQELTTANMADLTLLNAISDMTNFAKNALLPFDQNRTSTPDKAPWIQMGCSYSGALAAWTEATAPGTFWCTQASSAVVQAITDLWNYDETVGQAMATNCSTDYVQIIQAVDKVLLGSNQTAKNELKAKFGLAAVDFEDDFANALSYPLGAWQSNGFGRRADDFFQMCDYVENQWPNSTAPAPGPEGVGVDKALDGLAKFFRDVFNRDACKDLGFEAFDVTCFNSHNASSPVYLDTSVGNLANRQWMWLLCDQPFEWWQGHGEGRDEGRFVSRLLTKEYFRAQCEYYFPKGSNGETYGLKEGRTVEGVNNFTGGWFNTDLNRVSWAAGQWDPWLPATPMSHQRPGGPLANTPEHPVHLVPGGAHCGDLTLKEYNANEGVRKVMDAELAALEKWVAEFYEEKELDWPSGKISLSAELELRV